MIQQHGSGDFHPTAGQVDATVNIYNTVIANFSNQASTFSRLDEIYQTSVNDNAHQRPFMAPSSLPYVFPGPQTRVEVPDSKIAVQVDSMADGAQNNPHFDSDTSQTEVVPNSSDHERYKTEETQIPMMQFGAEQLPDDCSYLPTSFKSTSGSRWLHTKPEEANWALQTHNEGEQLAPLSGLYTPQDRGKRVERIAKKTYQCSSCQVIFTQRQGLSRHRKDKHEPKNRCGFCKVFTWSKGRHYTY
ncbi:hypothetical protein EDB86DRAFT_1070689 [Lactarius hatsudake]|nr:hypothetical protein EDB86DRAFT_1070689 [Lactarius hatsudake]